MANVKQCQRSIQASLRAKPAQGFLFVFVLALALASCGGAQIEMQSSYPLPLVQPIPVHGALLTDAEFKSYKHEETIEGHGDWRITFGQDQQRMFEQTMRGLFATTSNVAGLGQAAMGAELVVKPNVVRSEISIPGQTQTEFFEVRIVYRIELLEPEGREVLNWTVSAYGRSDTRNFRVLGSSESGSALAAATRTALRDASALISRQLSMQSGVRTWLQERASENG